MFDKGVRTKMIKKTKESIVNLINNQYKQMKFFCTSIYFIIFKVAIITMFFIYGFVEIIQVQRIFHVGTRIIKGTVIIGVGLNVLTLIISLIKKNIVLKRFKKDDKFQWLLALSFIFWFALLEIKLLLLLNYKIEFTSICIFALHIGSFLIILFMLFGKIIKSSFHEKGHGKCSEKLNDGLTHLYMPRKTVIFGLSSVRNFKEMLNAGSKREIRINLRCFLVLLIIHTLAMSIFYTYIHHILINLLIITMYFTEYITFCWVGGFSDFRVLEQMDNSHEINDEDLCIMITFDKDREEEINCIEIPKEYKCGQWINKNEKYVRLGYKIFSGESKKKVEELKTMGMLNDYELNKISETKYIYQHNGEVKTYEDRSFIKSIFN